MALDDFPLDYCFSCGVEHRLPESFYCQSCTDINNTEPAKQFDEAATELQAAKAKYEAALMELMKIAPDRFCPTSGREITSEGVVYRVVLQERVETGTPLWREVTNMKGRRIGAINVGLGTHFRVSDFKWED